jgi:hypothetical protein
VPPQPFEEPVPQWVPSHEATQHLPPLQVSPNGQPQVPPQPSLAVPQLTLSHLGAQHEPPLHV